MKKIKKLFVGILAFVCALGLCACFGEPNPNPNPNPGTDIVTPEPDPKPEPKPEPEPKQTFTVSFETNGAPAEADKKAEEGSEVELPAAQKDGSVFVGWYETDACEGAPLNGGYIVTKDVTLYAKWATPSDVKYFLFELDAVSDTYRITGTTSEANRDDTADLVIPLEYNGKPVSGIANGGVDNFDSVPKIIIGSNITYIEYGAFSHLYETENIYVDPSNPVFFSEGNAVINKKKYTAIFLEQETEIPEYTLIAGTKDVEIPSCVTSIGAFAFGCSHNLTKIEIPSTVKKIGMGAFLETYLVEVTFPEGVEQIDSDVFLFCGEIEKIVLPVSLKILAPTALTGIDSAAAYTVTYNGTRAQWNKLTENWTADEKAAVSVRCSDDPAA